MCVRPSIHIYLTFVFRSISSLKANHLKFMHKIGHHKRKIKFNSDFTVFLFWSYPSWFAEQILLTFAGNGDIFFHLFIILFIIKMRIATPHTTKINIRLLWETIFRISVSETTETFLECSLLDGHLWNKNKIHDCLEV